MIATTTSSSISVNAGSVGEAPMGTREGACAPHAAIYGQAQSAFRDVDYDSLGFSFVPTGFLSQIVQHPLNLLQLSPRRGLVSKSDATNAALSP